VDVALHTPGRNVHALRPGPEPHRELLLKHKCIKCSVLSNDTYGRGHLHSQEARVERENTTPTPVVHKRPTGVLSSQEFRNWQSPNVANCHEYHPSDQQPITDVLFAALQNGTANNTPPAALAEQRASQRNEQQNHQQRCFVARCFENGVRQSTFLARLRTKRKLTPMIMIKNPVLNGGAIQ
jgi:hypothetical protein